MSSLKSVIKSFGDFEIQEIVKQIAVTIEDISWSLSCDNFTLYTSEFNSYGEAISHADQFANDTFQFNLKNSCNMLFSEELKTPVRLNSSSLYDVTIDPLDGSSNLETNGPVGSIFSIIDKATGLIVVAGYALYGSLTTLVIATKMNVKMFSLSIESKDVLECFKLVNHNVCCPYEGTYYSINESYSRQWDDPYTESYISWAKETNHTARNLGCMVADCHQVLLKGGLFVYPSTRKHKDGKLRSLYEAKPMTFIFNAAYGSGVDLNSTSLLNVSKERTPVVIGSIRNTIKYFQIHS